MEHAGGQDSRAVALAPEQPRLIALDIAIQAGALTAAGTGAAVRLVQRAGRPVTALVLEPPLVGVRYRPRTWIGALAAHGARRRHSWAISLAELVDHLLPAVVSEVLGRLDLTGLVTEHVDLDRVVASVDLDGAVSRVDLDAIVASVDVDAVAARLDVEAVLDRLDLDAIVAKRLDLDAIVASVDVDAVAARLDTDAVIARIDLVGLAEQVIEAIDLPEIIRESTGSVASEAVRGVRMQGISGDQAVSRAVDRLRLRRNRPPSAGSPRSTDTAGPSVQLPGEPAGRT